MPPTIPAALLKDFVTELFARSGLSPEHAHTTAEVLVRASVRGVDSHGVARVPRYLELLSSGEANPDPVMSPTSTAGAVAVLDADRAPGPLALTLAAREAVARARAGGIGAVGVRQTVHTGAIGYYTSLIAADGLAGIVFVAGMPNMGYPGVRGAAVATSPLSIAVPVQGGPPALLDMATAGIALGRIAQYRNSGQTLPDGVAATADGTPTTDPNLAKLPLGGAKGAGMSPLFELITSVLVGAPILASVHGPAADRTHRQNALLIAVDPAAFGTGSHAEAARATVDAEGPAGRRRGRCGRRSVSRRTRRCGREHASRDRHPGRGEGVARTRRGRDQARRHTSARRDLTTPLAREEGPWLNVRDAGVPVPPSRRWSASSGSPRT